MAVVAVEMTKSLATKRMDADVAGIVGEFNKMRESPRAGNVAVLRRNRWRHSV
jgi:hypothetical protein